MRWRAPVLALLGVVLGFFLARALLLDAMEQVGLRIGIDALFGEPPPFGHFSVASFAVSSVAIRIYVGLVAGGVAGWVFGDRLDRRAPVAEATS